MDSSFEIGELLRLYCEGQPQDKFYYVLEVANDIDREPPMYRLFCLNTGDDAGWHFEHHSMSRLYSFKRVSVEEFLY